MALIHNNSSDYILIPSSASLLSTNMSWGIWYKTSGSLPDDGDMFFRWGQNGIVELFFSSADSKLNIRIYYGATSTTIKSLAALTTSTVYDVSVSYTQGGNFELYLNGVSQGSASVGTINMYGGDSRCYLNSTNGAATFSGGTYWDYRQYNAAIDDTDASDIYNAPNGADTVKVANRVCRLFMNEKEAGQTTDGNPNEILDDSGNNNHGTPTAGMTYADAEYPYTPPHIPTGVTASDGTYPDKVTISCDLDANATDYDFQRSDTDGGAYVSLSGWQASNTFDDTTGIVEQVYYYKVRAKDAITTTALSASDSGYSHYVPPSIPTNIVATNGEYSDKVVISCDADPLATHYDFWRADVSGGTYASISGWQAGNSYNDTTGVVGHTYYYKVRAKDATTTTDFSVADGGFSSILVLWNKMEDITVSEIGANGTFVAGSYEAAKYNDGLNSGLNSGNILLVNVGKAFTIDFWNKALVNSSDNSWIMEAAGISRFEIQLNGGLLRAEISSGGAVADYVFSMASPNAFSINDIFHLRFVFDSDATDKIRLFKDKNENPNTAKLADGTWTTLSGLSLSIGAGTGSASVVDNIKVWDKATTDFTGYGYNIDTEDGSAIVKKRYATYIF